MGAANRNYIALPRPQRGFFIVPQKSLTFAPGGHKKSRPRKADGL